jgi:hypothetical protein
MKKLFLIALLGFFLGAHTATGAQPEYKKNAPDKSEKRENILNGIENGRTAWEVFVHAIESGQVKFKEVSPSAVANYMEAFANEGILKSIPDQYFRNEEIQTALDVVFEDPTNVIMNRNAYEAHLKQVLDINYKCL